MKTSYGSRVMAKPEGMLRAFTVTNLVRLDEETGDGRLLESAGAGSRELPRTYFGGFDEGDPHGNNVPIGRLDAIEFDPENHTATGWGWLLDNEAGRQAALYVSTQTMRHNSIHMTEVDRELIWKSDDPTSPDFWEYTIIFHKFNVASATMLGIPAFANSEISLDADLTAALQGAGIFDSDEPLDLTASVTTVDSDMNMPGPDEELVAAMKAKTTPPWEYFFTPEPAESHGVVVDEVDERGFYHVYGHLAQWNVCHDGIEARCVIAPRPTDGYSNFNASNVLTSKGMVCTGPLFFKNGHPDEPLGDREAHKAYGGVENAWADVRVTEGLHGPWVSGVVRPHITDDVVYVARASRISGHWAGDGRLKAIVSVNVPGYDNKGRGESRVYTDADGNVLELVASYVGGCEPTKDTDEFGRVVAATFDANTVLQNLGFQQSPPFAPVPNSSNIFINTPVMTSERMVEMLQQLGYEVRAPLTEEAVAALALLELDEMDDVVS